MVSRRTFAALVLVGGCASTGESKIAPVGANLPDGGPDGSGPAQSFGDGGSATPQDGDCPDASKSVYVIDTANTLRRFDPPSGTFSALGTIDCGPGAGSPFSMAVARDGTAWVLYTSGNLFKVSTKDASCSPSSFKPQEDLAQFGMGFVSDEVDGKTETLYISSYQRAQLGKIAFDTMTVTPVASFSENARMELTGTGSGQLFGLLAPVPDEYSSGAWTVAEISKSSGDVLTTKVQDSIMEGDDSNFAFAAWGGDFYSFVGPSVYRYDTKTTKVSLLTTVDFVIVGAGVSTCAPHAIVK